MPRPLAPSRPRSSTRWPGLLALVCVSTSCSDTGQAPPAPERDASGPARDSGGPSESGDTARPDLAEPPPRSWFPDQDGDSHGDIDAAPVEAVRAPEGHVDVGDDCDDQDASVYPGAPETCDGRDEDCDGASDEDAQDAFTWHPDSDGDGAGAEAESVRACEAPDGYLEDATDCYDGDPTVYPGAEELCGDDIDNDCDGHVDEVPPGYDEWVYPDLDGDGYGDDAGITAACTAPTDYVETGGDCDDGDPSAYPGAREVCGAADWDCDGIAGDDDTDSSSTWYDDRDGDGFGDPSHRARVSGCSAPAGTVDNDDDCDDSEAAISPDAAETCGDEVDENCDGMATDCDFWGDHVVSEVGARVTGPAGARLGYPCVGAGDLDDDGRADLWLSGTTATSSDESRGAAWLLSGPSEAGDVEDLAVAVIRGDTANAFTGWRVLDAGDMDGDGYTDVWVSSPWDIETGIDGGSASLFVGPHLGERTLGDADLEWHGVDTQERAGYSVAGGQDLDGDTLMDSAVASIFKDAGAEKNGEVALLYQDPIWGSRSLDAADIRLYGESAEDMLGRNLTMASDLDGDGIPELVIASTANDAGGETAGAFYILRDVLDRGDYDPADVAQRVVGQRAGLALGSDLVVVGDLDADGYDDLAVGASGDDTLAPAAGATFVFHGPLEDVETSADAASHLLGAIENGNATAIAGGEDIDGDGTPDLVVGGSSAGSGSDEPGLAWLLLGPLDEGTEPLDDAAGARLQGASPSSATARSVAMPGDLNGDGLADVVVGAPEEGDAYEGAAWLVLMPSID